MDGAKVKKYLQQQFDSYVKDLETLTNVDSGNGDPAGTDRAARFVGEKLQALGATPKATGTLVVAAILP